MPPRWPSWNAHTTTPKVAVIDSRFMITAFTGSTTLPVNSQSSTMLARRTKPMAKGRWRPRLSLESRSWRGRPADEHGERRRGGAQLAHDLLCAGVLVVAVPRRR